MRRRDKCRSAVTHTIMLPSPSLTTPSSGTARRGPVRDANDECGKHASAQFVLRVGNFGAYPDPMRAGVHRGGDGGNFSVEYPAWERHDPDLDLLADFEVGLSASATFASIHIVEMSATENGAGAFRAERTVLARRCAR